MSVHELAFQRSKYKHLSDSEWRWFLQQVEGRERTADKLPTFARIDDWWYPVRLSCEQCSSEYTARYKAQIVNYTSQQTKGRFIDLTAGYGVDTYFLSEHFEHTDYVERDPELCRIAAHNFSLSAHSSSLTVHNTTAEEFFSHNSSHVTGNRFDLIFADPARRDSHGGKVFRLEDCTPNIVELLPTILEHLTPEGRVLLKLSPMLDITQAIKNLSSITSPLSPLSWDIHIVAIKNEVKEVLLLSGGNGTITAIDLGKKDQAFVFTREEESLSTERSFDATVFQCNGLYIYEPNASILKAGAYKLVATRFGLTKLDPNTHLYVSDTLVENFPGRVWKIQSQITNHKLQITNANVLVRNYPLTPEQVKKKLRIHDGGDTYIIGCRIAGKPTLLHAERI